MLTAKDAPIPNWQQLHAAALREVQELLQTLHLDQPPSAALQAVTAKFPMRVPRSFAAQMQVGDANDPLLRQVLPQAAELEEVDGFVADPLAEQAALVAPGVLHKYHGRALLIASAACAVHCRYCFRREFPYSAQQASTEHWQAALAYLRSDESLREIILSGGDPLTLSNQRLETLLCALENIPHIERLRIHTRVPIVLPQRVDAGLVEILAQSRLQRVIVLHANHPREIADTVSVALQRLSRTGATLLNQSVLLRGVNDAVEILAELSEVLFSSGVLPYYLHLLDPVRGTAHFAVKEDHALAIMKALRQRLPGYLAPRLVCEQAGELAKTLLEGGGL